MDGAIDISSLLDKDSFEKWVKDSSLEMDSELVKAIENFRKYLHKAQVDENKKITNEWSKLVEKYGDLQSKLVKISKETAQEQLDAIRKFGTDEESDKATELVKKIKISQDPDEIARLQKELTKRLISIIG